MWRSSRSLSPHANEYARYSSGPRNVAQWVSSIVSTDDRPALRKRRTQLSADWVSLPSSEEARTFRASISRATSDATNAGRRRSSISRTRLLAAFDGALEGFHVHRTRHPPGPITRRTSSKHRLRPKRGWPKPERTASNEPEGNRRAREYMTSNRKCRSRAAEDLSAASCTARTRPRPRGS